MRLASHSQVDITKKARPYLEELSRITGETAVLMGASGKELMILHSVVSSHTLWVVPVPRSFLSIYASSGGKTILSEMDDGTVHDLLGPALEPSTPQTPTLSLLLKQLAEIRLNGFAYSFEEYEVGVGAIAVGLQTLQGHYAIDVVGPVWRIEQAEDAIKDVLVKCRDGLISGLRSID